MTLRFKEFTNEKHKDHCLIYPCKCKTHKYFCTKKEIDSFIQLDSKTLHFILSKYTNWNILGKTDQFGNKIRYKRHSYLSKMCNFALNIKCMRSLSYYGSIYFDDNNQIDQYYDFNYKLHGNYKENYLSDQEINKIYGFNKYKNGIRKFIYNKQMVY